MINSTGITNTFSDVNETFPTVGRAGRIAGAFASASYDLTNKVGMDQTMEHDGVHIS